MLYESAGRVRKTLARPALFLALPVNKKARSQAGAGFAESSITYE
jgi:hypothetical protein